MTNAQSLLKEAVSKKESGKLSSWEESFIESLMSRCGSDPESPKTKKALRNISTKQFMKLRDIAKS